MSNSSARALAVALAADGADLPEPDRVSRMSTIHAIGTTLSRAHHHNASVALLVGEQWMRGRVHAVYAHGVVLGSVGTDRSILELERISAVRVLGAAPMRKPDCHGVPTPGLRD